MAEKRKSKTTYAAPNLRYYREQKKWSQVQLCKEAHVGRQTVLRLENAGAANGMTLNKLAEALGIAREDLESPPKNAAPVVTRNRVSKSRSESKARPATTTA